MSSIFSRVIVDFSLVKSGDPEGFAEAFYKALRKDGFDPYYLHGHPSNDILEIPYVVQVRFLPMKKSFELLLFGDGDTQGSYDLPIYTHVTVDGDD